MKKYLFLLFLALTIILSSCSAEKIDPLSYQEYPFTVEGTLETEEINYDFTLHMTDAASSEISFTKPDSLKSYIFRVTPKGTTLSYGDMTIDFNGGEKTNLIKLIPALFSLKKDDLVSSEETILNSTTIDLHTYKTDLGQIKVYQNRENGNPLRFEGEDFTLNVQAFTPSTLPTPTPTPAPQQ